jgi:protein kinase C substrate 80K-H
VSQSRFSGWNTAAPEGSPEYYGAQSYTNGAKCWNGPARSVVVCPLPLSPTAAMLIGLQLRLTCGLENELLTVAELEKCEYEITGTSPALCAPLAVENGKREEL